jgi:2-polyprenyl-3-methyl-5-hydroxy-6-metoxy-1,4-benzoquinol methylase
MNYNSEEYKSIYTTYHKKRFKYLLDKIDLLCLSPDSRILDIGRGPFTKILSRKYSNVSTMGLDLSLTSLDKADSINTDIVPHIVFDLNNTKSIQVLNNYGKFKLIIFAEVIEHLMVHPENVFHFLDSILEVGGYIILQTPNAVSITKRIKPILGIHPFMEYNLDGEVDSHHFREYTKSELFKYVKKVGFEIVEHEYLNYFPSSTLTLRAIYFVSGIVPSFRNAQSMILKKTI